MEVTRNPDVRRSIWEALMTCHRPGDALSQSELRMVGGEKPVAAIQNNKSASPKVSSLRGFCRTMATNSQQWDF